MNIQRILVPLLFPLIAAVGASILRLQGTAWVNWALLVLISVYVCKLMLGEEPTTGESVAALYGIGLSLAFLNAFRSPFVSMNGDIPFEQYVLLQVLESGWALDMFNGSESWMRYVGLTSLTAYPMMLGKLTGLGADTFRVGYRVIEAAIPVIVFGAFDRIASRKAALAAALLFAFQFVFTTLIGSIARMSIAFVLFFTLVIVYTRPDIQSSRRVPLLGLLFIGVSLSHYTVALLTIAIFIGYQIVRLGAGVGYKLTQLDSLTRLSQAPPASLNLTVLFAAILFLWYGYVTTEILVGIAGSVGGLLSSLDSLFVTSSSSAGNSTVSIGGLLTRAVYYGTIVLGGVGFLTLWWRPEDESIPPMWHVLGGTAFLGLGATFVVTQVFGGYGPFRVFYQVLPFIALPMILGLARFSNRIASMTIGENRNVAQIAIAAFLIVHLLAGTYAIYELSGESYGEMLSADGDRVDVSVIDPEEDGMARWSAAYIPSGTTIWADYHGEHIVVRYRAVDGEDGIGFSGPGRDAVSGCIALRDENVDQQMLNTKFRGKVDLSSIDHLLEKRSKVYSSGSSVYC